MFIAIIHHKKMLREKQLVMRDLCFLIRDELNLQNSHAISTSSYKSLAVAMFSTVDSPLVEIKPTTCL